LTGRHGGDEDADATDVDDIDDEKIMRVLASFPVILLLLAQPVG
jgi:hypothetical protein